MIRKAIFLLLFSVIALMISTPIALGQQQTKLPKQNPFLTPIKDPSTAAGAALQGALNKSQANGVSSNNNAHLPLFNYTVTSSRDGNSYSGTIVGRSPFTEPFGFTAVPSQIVPVIVVTNSVFAGIANGDVVTVPGVTVFNPSMADNSCLTAPNDIPLKLVQQSPIFKPADFNYGGTDVGFTETTDAFQRANFFKLLNFGSSSDSDNFVYHVILSPVNTISAIVINVPAANGIAYPSAVFGGCPTGTEAIVDINVYEPGLFSAIATTLGKQGVNPASFPMFVTHNVVECEALAAGVNCGDVLNPNSVCCILGFHDSSGQQTIGTADFDTSGIFVSPVPDVSDMSHEVAEWMNDPFGNNLVPPWGHIGQQPGCQNNLEVGDPLSGTLAPPIFNPVNGFTYHLQELAFFSWFYGAPSVGIHGWFSDNDTFTTDAGPVCQ
ncbi:MAG: hypothetical protein WB630_04090 [Candidatus Acidiferrales bacterium]